MMKLLKNDERFTHGYMNYPRVNVDPLKRMGPTNEGLYIWPVEVEKTDKGYRVGFSFTSPFEETE